MNPKALHDAGLEPVATSANGARLFIRSFVAVMVALVVLLAMLRLMPLPASIIDDPLRRGMLEVLPSDEVAAIKLRYADRHTRYDIGLFGNSRILMIGSDELKVDRRMFNFAVPGQSVRQSILLLEALRGLGKAPALAVISMDYVELGLPGGAGVYPGPPARWFGYIVDAWIAWEKSGVRGPAASIFNAAANEGSQITLTFNHTYILTKLRAVLGLGEPTGDFRSDGSRKEIVPSRPTDLGRLPQRADDYPQLESDFARLAAVRDSGTRVLVYESPVAPPHMNLNDSSLSAKARAVRRRFHAACEVFRLECHGPPLLTQNAWFDRDHAPAAALAAWLRPLIEH